MTDLQELSLSWLIIIDGADDVKLLFLLKVSEFFM